MKTYGYIIYYSKKKRKQPKCTSTGEWISKMWYYPYNGKH